MSLHQLASRVIYDSTRKTLKIVTESGSFDLSENLSEPLISKIMAKIRGGSGKSALENSEPR